MMDFLQIKLLPHQKVVYNFLNTKQFLVWDEVVVAIFGIKNKIVFECTLCVVSKHKEFDYKWEGLILDLIDKITFTKDQNVIFVSSLRHLVSTSSLPLLLDNPLLTKFKTLPPARSVSLMIAAPHGLSHLMSSPMVDILLHFKKLIEFIKGNNVLTKWQTP